MRNVGLNKIYYFMCIYIMNTLIKYIKHIYLFYIHVKIQHGGVGIEMILILAIAITHISCMRYDIATKIRRCKQKQTKTRAHIHTKCLYTLNEFEIKMYKTFHDFNVIPFYQYYMSLGFSNESQMTMAKRSICINYGILLCTHWYTHANGKFYAMRVGIISINSIRQQSEITTLLKQV